MGDKTFTFTGLLEDEPKKEQVVTTVKVPRFEYARLVAAKAKLDMVEKIVNSMDSYDCKKMLDVLFSEEKNE